MTKEIDVDGANQVPGPTLTRMHHSPCSVWRAEIKPNESERGYALDVRIFDVGRPSTRLRAAFSSQVASVTLRDDLPMLEALVNSVIDALATDGHAPHGSKLNDLWAAERARLEARWQEIEGMDVSLDEVVLGTTHNLASPALVYRSTSMRRKYNRYVRDDIWGVFWDASGKPDSVDRHSGMTFQPLTQENLATVSVLSGHEKLELLADSGRATLNRLRRLFEEMRLFNASSLKAVDLDDAFALNNEIYFTNGRYSSFHAGRRQKNSNLIVRLEDDKAGIWLDTSKTGMIQLGRNVTSDKRFKSKAALDEWVRSLIELILAYDPDLSDEFLSGLKLGAFDPKHPLLKGLFVPPKHHSLIGTILGKPYEAAKASAERFAARNVKKAEKAEAANDLAKEIADGAIFGKIEFSRWGDLSALYGGKFQGTKLWRVRTRPAPSNRRMREMASFTGGKPRPLTPKQMSRLPLLTKPNALARLSDAALGGDDRDVIEAAYRLSFDLPGEARNPILEAEAQVNVTPSQDQTWALRTTVLDFENTTLLGLSVCFPRRDSYNDYHKTGAGFCIMMHDGQGYSWARPAIYNNGYQAPSHHHDVILHVLQKKVEQDTLTTEVFRTRWSQLVKEYR
ncbi:hypothetical protein [Celeribacter sp. ULVN23_4]